MTDTARDKADELLELTENLYTTAEILTAMRTAMEGFRLVMTQSWDLNDRLKAAEIYRWSFEMSTKCHERYQRAQGEILEFVQES
jgi:predicted phage tail protein